MKPLILNYSEYGVIENPPLIILHGFLGSSKNWMTIGKILSENFRVITVDLRNHGDSFHHDQHTYEDMVDDVIHLMDHLKIDKVLMMGHSMGGKVVMKLACNYPNRLFKLVVVDIAPKQYFPHRKEIVSMQAIDLQNLKNRQVAEEQLSIDIPDLGLRKFLLTNLAQDAEGRFRWKVNLAVFSKEIPQLGGNPILETEKYLGETLFILGAKSDFVKEFDYPIIYKHFPKAEIEVIENSDHNPHFTAREKFLEILVPFLNHI